MTYGMGSPFKSALIAVALAVGASMASAQPAVPLEKEAHINESLVAVAVGDVIRKTCPSISARMVTVYFKAKDLENYARDKGYAEDEVKAFLKDKDQKARIKANAAEYMANNGVVEGNVDSYCALGHAEIAKQSLIGSLLKD